MEAHVLSMFKVDRDTLSAPQLAARVGCYLPVFLYNEDLVCVEFTRINEFGDQSKYEFPM